jgi:hypothetical protein
VLLGATDAFAQGATTALHGKWELDHKRTKATVKAEQGDEKAAELEVFEGISISLEFKHDGKVEMVVRGGPIGADADAHSGAWKVVDERPMQLKIEIKLDDGGGGDATRIEIRFLDKDSLRLVTDEDKQVMVFRRVAAPTK